MVSQDHSALIQRIEGQDGNPEEVEDDACRDADHDKENLHGSGIGFEILHPAFADHLSDKEGSCGAGADSCGLDDQEQVRGCAVGCQYIGSGYAHMAKDGILGRIVQAPEGVDHQDGQHDAYIIGS